MSVRTRRERISAARARIATAVLTALACLGLPTVARAQQPVPVAPVAPDPLISDTPPAVVAPGLGAVAAAPCTGAGRRSSLRKQTVLVRCLVNRARARAGLRPLRANRALARAAGRHATDMGRRHFFSHTNLRGRSPAARARAAGWHGRRIGEALAFSCGPNSNPLWVVASWLASPSHRAIVLSAGFTQAGIGVGRRSPTRCGGGRSYALEAGR